MAYLSSIVASRFEHPILASLLGVAIGFAVAGVLMQEFTSLHPVAPAFMGVFAILWAGLSLLGYGIFGTAKLLSMVRDEMAPTSG